MMSSMNPRTYIAVHGGAGAHSLKCDKEIRLALRNSCAEALRLSNTNQGLPGEASPSPPSSMAMVECAISVLEDDEHLNAGYGSNLALDGTVECDAAIMAAERSAFGSVSAVSGIKNPIQVARAVLEHAKIPDNLRRIPPLTLTGAGAYQFASRGGLQTVPPETLISTRAQEQWRKWIQRLQATDAVPEDEQQGLRNVQDTVGAVAWHESDGMVAGVSSGGLLLKHPGRVGEAAVYGAGCWAAHRTARLDGLACSISGTGEHIIRARLAQSLDDALREQGGNGDLHEILRRSLVEQFGVLCRGQGEENPSAGVLLLVSEDTGENYPELTLWCAFTTESMAIAYASSRQPKPKAFIFRNPNNGKPGKARLYITSISL